MRVALISDIHGNLTALNAVLRDIERADVKKIICLGDVADLGPQPSQCLERLRDLNIPIILGNHDPFEEHFGGEGELIEISQWCAQELSSSQREYLSSCPASMEMPLGEGRSLLCVHGSPRHFEEGISPATTNAELEEMLSGVSSDVICAGHTHVQLARRFCRQMVVNVGSVGCAFEEVFSGEPPTLLPWAEFAMISGDEGGVQVELKRCRYEISEQVQAILSSGMPHSVSWAKQWQRLVE